MLAQLRSLARHSAAYTVGSMIGKAFAFLLVPIYTRFMGQEDYGAWVLLHAGVAILAVLYELGISSSLTRHYYDFDDEKDRRRYIGTIWLFATAATALMSGLLLTLGRPLLERLFTGVDFWPYVGLVIIATFLSTSHVIPWVLMRVREQSTRFVLLVLAQTLVLLAGVIVFVVVLDLGLLGAVLALFTQSVLVFLFFTAYTLRNASLHVVWRYIGLSLGYGFPVLLLQVGWWVLDAADRFILRFLTSLETVAVYSVGYAIGRILIMVSQAINQAWTPFFFQTVKEDRPNAKEVFSYTATYFTLVISTFAVIVIVFARQAVLFFGGPDYIEATQVTPLVALGAVAQGMFYVPSRGLFLQKQTKWFPLVLAVGATTSIGLDFALIPSFGMMGAAIATLVSYVVTVAITFVLSQRYYRVDYQVGRLARILAVLVAITALSMIFTPEPWYALLAWQVALLVAAPLLLVATGFVERREWEALKEVWRSRHDRRRGGESGAGPA
jgi:O-antigen/teichoic acid export membrane protein